MIVYNKILFTFPDDSTQPLQNQKSYIASYMNSVTKQKKINAWSKHSQRELQESEMAVSEKTCKETIFG